MLEQMKRQIEERGYQIVLCLKEPAKESYSLLLSTVDNLHLLTVSEEEHQWHKENSIDKPFLMDYYLDEKIMTLSSDAPLRL